MKKKEERMEKQMNEIMAENKRLTEPLQKAREEVEELRKQVKPSNKYYDQSIIIVFLNFQLCSSSIIIDYF